MRTSDELFRLIRSLSKSEKRYFKLFASLQSGEKKYLRLFDAIDAQDEYDEEAIRKKFSGERFTRQLNVAKRYLYDLILKSLRLYHAEHASYVEAKDLVKTAEILFEKGLTDQAKKLTAKAIRVAEEHQTPLPMLDGLICKSTIDFESLGSIEEIDELYDRADAELERLRLELKLRRRLNTIAFITARGLPRTPGERARLEEIASDPVVTTVSPDATLSTRTMALFIRAIYHHAVGEYREALLYTQAQIDLFDAHPAEILEYPRQYVMILTNLLLLHRLNGNIDEFWECVRHIRSVETRLVEEKKLKSPRVRYAIFTALYFNLLVYSYSAGRFEEGREIIEAIEKSLSDYVDVSSGDKICFHHQAALTYFGLGEYGRALEHNNSLMMETESARGEQHYYHARLFNIIIHFELGNIELLPYLVRSAYRSYSSRRMMYRFEATVLGFFRKLPNIATRSELTCALEQLKHDLLPLREDPYEKMMFNFFPYIDWLRSKIERRALGDILAEESLEKESRWGHAA